MGNVKATELQMHLPLQSTKHREYILQEGNKNISEISAVILEILNSAPIIASWTVVRSLNILVSMDNGKLQMRLLLSAPKALL